MTHVRKQIRDAIVTRITGLATTGDNVFPSYVYDVQSMPAWAVFALDEEIEEAGVGRPITQHRRLRVRIEGMAEGSEIGPADTLDQMAVEAEKAMQTDRTLGGLALDLSLLETEIGFSGEGEKPAGSIRLTYEVLYRTKEDDPENVV